MLSTHGTRESACPSDLLRKMRTIWESHTVNFNGIMMWAAFCLCYFVLLRSGEITVPSESAYYKGEHLSFTDVTVDSVSYPQILKVRRPYSN